MKKIIRYFWLAIALGVVGFIGYIIIFNQLNKSSTNDTFLEDRNSDGKPDGWEGFATNTAEQLWQMDETVSYDGESSLLLSSGTRVGLRDYVFVRNELLVNNYKGQRVQLSSYIKTEEITDGASLWIWVEGVGRGNILFFDSMPFRRIQGTSDWYQEALVIDVPNEATRLYIGATLNSSGKLWIDQLLVEPVAPDTPLTGIPGQVSLFENGDFEDALNGWLLATQDENYTVEIDSETAFNGAHSVFIEGATTAEEGSAEWVMQHLDIRPYRNQNILISGQFKTNSLSDSSSLVFLAESLNWTVPNANRLKSQELSATNQWQELSIIFPVHRQAESMILAFGLSGEGQFWLDDIQIESIGEIEGNEAFAQGQQLEVLHELSTLVTRKYIYDDFNGVDWEGLIARNTLAVENGLSNEDFWALMADTMQRLNDEHSSFQTPEQAELQYAIFEGEIGYSGIGVYVQLESDEKYHVVTYVFPDSPAEQAGLQLHDRLLLADGLPICCSEEADAPLGEVSGVTGTPVTLTIQTPGEDPREVVIERQPIDSEFGVISRLVADDIGYIFMSTFEFREMGEALTAAWADLNADNQLEGLVIDLRTNSGGLLTELNEVLSLFINGRSGEYFTQTEQTPLIIEGQDIANSQSIPLVLLVSGNTNSAAELLSGILQEAERATIIGTTTNGNVEVVYTYLLADGSTLLLAEEGFISNEGANWDGVGIVPDIEIDQLWRDFSRDEDDLALQEAIQQLQNE